MKECVIKDSEQHVAYTGHLLSLGHWTEGWQEEQKIS